MNCMLHFVHDDAGYLAWLSGHPDGFVINTYSSPSPAYLKLHQATCSTISRLQPGAKTFTGGQYSKICGDRDELEAHAHYGWISAGLPALPLIRRGSLAALSDAGACGPGLPDKPSLSV